MYKAALMTSDELNKLLKKHDLGDDWLEKNLLFDPYFELVLRPNFEKATAYANNKTAWYWTDQKKHYLLADCNRFAFIWLGHFQEWSTKHGVRNPAIGRAYGLWEGQPHAWVWIVVEDKLVFINWGQEVKPKDIKYSGKGSIAV